MQKENQIQNHNFVQVEAIKIGYRQAKEGDVITFRIHPSDYNMMIANLPLGTNVVLAIAEYQPSDSDDFLGKE